VLAQPEVDQLYHDLSFALNLADQLDAESPPAGSSSLP